MYMYIYLGGTRADGRKGGTAVETSKRDNTAAKLAGELLPRYYLRRTV